MNHKLIHKTALLTAALTSCLFAHVARAQISSTGQVYPSPMFIMPTDDLFVGDTFSGTLLIAGAETLEARTLSLGINLGVSGQVGLTGSGTLLDINYGLLAGRRGEATINILSGAQLNSSFSTLGLESTGNGVVTVDGAQSVWTHQNDMRLGYAGSGSLFITNGGKVVTHGYVDMASVLHNAAPSASGFARISGSGSVWEIDEQLTVGNYGQGTLEVLNGGTVTNTDRGGLRIGDSSYASGHVLIDGVGTLVDMEYLTIARGNNSSLEISGGATLQTGAVSAGLYDPNFPAEPVYDALAELAINGPGSNWQVNGSMVIGESAHAHLNVSGGAILSTFDALLGGPMSVEQVVTGFDTFGQATITGARSRWDATGNLLVGASSRGQLTIADQAVVQTTGPAGFGVSLETGLWVRPSGQGTLHLDNGILIAPTVLIAPESLTGIGQIQTHGWVLDQTTTYNSIADLPSQLSFSDSGSLDIDIQLDWTGPGQLFGAGYQGQGDITIAEFAIESEYGIVGFASTSAGRVTVDGAGSAWNSQQLSVGFGGVGEVALTNGGTMAVTSLVLGEAADAQGSLSASGAGTTFQTTLGSSSQLLIVGREGSGTLALDNGASLVAGNTVLGQAIGGTGSVVVNNASWASGIVTIGELGQGSFTVGQGGTLEASLLLGRYEKSWGTASLSGPGTTWNNANLTIGNGAVLLENGAFADLITIDLATALANAPAYDIEDILYIEYAQSQLTVRGADTRLVADELSLGESYGGVATAMIDQGAIVEPHRLYLGSVAGSLGTMVVDGPSTMMALGDVSHVGERGQGQLTIQNGATVQGTTLIAGTNPNASGQVTVQGAGSMLALTGDLALYYAYDPPVVIETDPPQPPLPPHLDVEDSVVSSLSILDGASVQVAGTTYLTPSTNPSIASPLLLANGQLTTHTLLADSGRFSGAGTIWTDSMLLDGTWVLDPTSGLPTSIVISNQPGDLINVNVSWADPEGLFGAGTGTTADVRLTGGFDITTQDGYIGLIQGGDGLLTVHGQTTRWTVNDDLFVGYGGIGTLVLSDRGVVKSLDTYIGRYETGVGELRVDGAGSILDTTDLYVGSLGSGQLRVLNGGLVLADVQTIVGHFEGGNGLIEISGDASTLVTGDIDVGDHGVGELRFTDGAAGFLQDLVVGRELRSAGRLVIDGEGTQVQATTLLLGRSGTAQLEVTGGGQLLVVGGDANLAIRTPNLPMPVTVLVSGPQSLWQTKDLTIGAAKIRVEDGGVVISDSVRLGHHSSFTSRADFVGEGSQWSILQSLSVGHNSNPARLLIADGASANVGTGLTLGLRSELILGVNRDNAPSISVSGDATLGGLFGVRVDSSALPFDGSETVVLDIAGTQSGTFINAQEGERIDVLNGFGLFLSYVAGDGNDIGIRAEQYLPGDLNGSGSVDEQDLTLVVANWGQQVLPGRWLLGDANNDGLVEFNDLRIVLSEWDSDTPPPFSDVPEPGALGIFALGALVLLRRSTSRQSLGNQTSKHHSPLDERIAS